MNRIAKRIAELKSKAILPMHDKQIGKIPHIEEMTTERISFYDYQEQRYLISSSTMLCFSIPYSHFKSFEGQKAVFYYNAGMTSLEDLFSNKVIQQFLVFINGIFVPWKYLSLLCNASRCYLLFEALDDTSLAFITEQKVLKSKVEILALPDSFKYYDTDYEEVDPSGIENFIFGFDNDWMYNSSSCSFYITNVNSKVEHLTVTSSEGFAGYLVSDDKYRQYDEECCIVFGDGLLDTTTMSESEFFGPVYRNDTEETTEKYYHIFYNTYSGDSVSHSSRFDPEALANYVSNVDDIENDDIIALIRSKFNLKMDKYTKYYDNLKAAVEYGISYDGGRSIFDEAYKRDCGVFCIELTGAQVIAAAAYTDDNTFNISRFYNLSLDDYVMILQNGVIYNRNRYYTNYIDAWSTANESDTNEENTTDEDPLYDFENYMNEAGSTIDEWHTVSFHTYYSNEGKFNCHHICTIPAEAVKEDDIIEVIVFRHINNVYYNTIVQKDEPFLPISQHVLNLGSNVFCSETEDDFFDFPLDGIQHFPVKFTIESNEEYGQLDPYKRRIRFNSDFYYGKEITVANKRRFVHATYIITEEQAKTFYFDLGTEFMYCNQYGNYTVFYDGKRLDSDKYRLVLPVRTTTPFYLFYIYLALEELEEGKTLDIFYTPTPFHDIYTGDLSEDGYIDLDRSTLPYPLSTDTYFFWVNGVKVPASKIKIIDSHRAQLEVDMQSTNWLAITPVAYQAQDAWISESFRKSSPEWDEAIKDKTVSDICTLLGINPVAQSNTTAVDAYMPIQSVVYELIMHWYVCNHIVDSTQPFLYDYQTFDTDMSAIECYDYGNDAVLPVIDANVFIRVEPVERTQP